LDEPRNVFQQLTETGGRVVTNAPGDHYVYMYRDPSSLKALYVGYGMSPGRALSRPGKSDNEKLYRRLSTETYDLLIAGPYRDREEGLKVEAALISALKPSFNRIQGHGPKFRPVGVPNDLADRLTLDPLSEPELGTATNGALAVYLSPGKLTVDGRQKVDPAQPDTETIAVNVEGWWQVDRHIEQWRTSRGPRILLGVHGPLKHRFIMGSFVIDTSRWGEDPHSNQQRSLWRIPLVDRNNADACGLRGRRVAGLRFGRSRWEHYRWIDETGTTRHPSI
jgi:hypothetical protein